ncbi:hypothetical protein GALMADRAFT_162481 [Galerina marginata CBS 339.88]|uniref:Uncharacterized protein n=1 Tax=Galerina marginata (strain CBS 339.88) TaxID=685588 RepID=A0A067SBH2_GALM3|nr:hypothetical protein GALMADRAFT_162481 [Galerina marginata CBS 339.88]
MFSVSPRKISGIRGLIRHKCYMVVSPNPSDWQDHKPKEGRCLIPGWDIKFGDTNGSVERAYASKNPSFVVAYNDAPKRWGKVLEKRTFARMHKGVENVKQYGRTRSEWYRLFNNGQKDAQGKGLSEILLDIFEKFPGYDLTSEKGLAQAADEINAALALQDQVPPPETWPPFPGVMTKGLPYNVGVISNFHRNLLARTITDPRYWKGFKSIDWVEISTNIFDNTYGPGQLEHYCIEDVLEKYEAVQQLEGSKFGHVDNARRPEGEDEKDKGTSRLFTADELKNFKDSQEYNFYLQALSQRVSIMPK